PEIWAGVLQRGHVPGRALQMSAAVARESTGRWRRKRVYPRAGRWRSIVWGNRSRAVREGRERLRQISACRRLVARLELQTRVDRRARQKALHHLASALDPERFRHPGIFASHRGFVGCKFIGWATEDCQIEVEEECAIMPGGFVAKTGQRVTSGRPDHRGNAGEAVGTPNGCEALGREFRAF